MRDVHPEAKNCLIFKRDAHPGMCIPGCASRSQTCLIFKRDVHPGMHIPGCTSLKRPEAPHKLGHIRVKPQRRDRNEVLSTPHKAESVESFGKGWHNLDSKAQVEEYSH